MDAIQTAVALGLDRVLAHQTLFRYRHGSRTPPFHKDLIEAWHSPAPRVLTMAFRGAAKSTIAEEALLIKAAFREFKNGLIIGESQERADERLESIRHEIESNELISELFGDLVGPTWGAGELVLSNGVRIKSLGRGCALRGIKFHDQRPDAVFIDDLESEENSSTAVLRSKTKRWFYKSLTPALAPEAILRMAATPVHVECLAEDLRQSNTWNTHVFPIETLGENNQRIPAWPARYPLDAIDNLRETFIRSGLLRDYEMEYLCRARTTEDQTFKTYMFRTEARVRTWEAVYGMFDPARTVKSSSASTGFACWSWIGPRLQIWDSWARMLMPDEIIASLFQFAETYDPVIIGVEEDGLNEFLMQPIRAEQTRRGMSIPVRPYKAPKGKLDFIKALQPFFGAREVVFQHQMKELVEQLLSFPTGRIDAPNALAYALRMRPGAPIYDAFAFKFVDESLTIRRNATSWLAVNCDGHMMTAVLVQMSDGQIRILADWVREGDADTWLRTIQGEAQMEAQGQVRLVIGPHHFDRHNNFGLAQAIRRLPQDERRGVDPSIGRAEIRRAMGVEIRGAPSLVIHPRARWTLNAFASGYCRVMLKGGQLADYAEEGAYRVLMEGLETLVGLQAVRAERDDDTPTNYAYTPDGRRYVSAMARRA